ncbi:MAG TPA: protoheme IX farnesyltransferase [Nitrospirota bacterium]
MSGRVLHGTSVECARGLAEDTPDAVVSALLVLKPGIALGVSVAGFAGMALAGGGLPDPSSGMTTVACILMAAMGSAAMNVVLEAGTDLSMSRLAKRNRALSSLGRRAVLGVGAALVAASLAVSYHFLNAEATLLIIAASASYTILYTLCLKRRSPYGTVAGGIPGALPVLIGYASVKPSIGLDGLILFSLMLAWQPPHFLALALKYRGDYDAAGLPSMPSAFGEPYTKTFIFIYATALMPLVAALWSFGYLSAWSGATGCLLTMLYLWSSGHDIFRTKMYGRAFAVSILYIIALMGIVIADAGLT